MAEEKNKNENGIDRFVVDLMYINNIPSSKKNTKTEDAKKIFSCDLSNKKTMVSWNVDNFLQYCSQNIQNVKWQNVFSAFDR